MLNKKQIEFFDIHSHLHSSFFKNDIQKIIQEMKDKNIWTISIGVDLEDSKKAVKLAVENENFYSTIGIHPTEKEIFDEEKFQKLIDENKKIVGIGECGLDYFWLEKDLKDGKISIAELENEKIRQRILFERQINFSVKNNLPLMLHVRSFKNGDAHEDVLKILDRKQKELSCEPGDSKKKIKANFHFYTENIEITKKIIQRDYRISFPGVITFANIDESIKEIPLEKIMSETDSPFATPKPHRGEVNTPLYVNEIVKKIAEVKKLDFNEVKKQMIKNALDFWKI